MAPMKKYGRAKAKVSSTAASAIFGVASPSREPLDDITVALENLKVDGSSICPDRPTTPRSLSESPIHSPESKQPSSLSNITVSNPDDATSSSQSSLPNQESLSEVLKPLLESYEADCHDSIEELPWSDLLPSSATVAKIAEASFAEVFRVTSSIGETSILKIMPLRVPSDPGSLEMDTAIQIEDVVSEVRIMNALTTLPGFVIFKAAYIVQGKPSIDFIEAHNKHSDSRGGSYFPDPDTYTSSSVFLVIELDDAGDALDDIDIDSVDAIWDILLGVIIAVSKAETAYEFEVSCEFMIGNSLLIESQHRDMHENNICIFYKEPQVLNLPEEVKYGRSGYQVTILDYGLSRATLESGEYIYNNLENDLMLFRSIGDSVAKHQFDAYRRYVSLKSLPLNNSNSFASE
jgi:serine/threonine-protein kinase haspin